MSHTSSVRSHGLSRQWRLALVGALVAAGAFSAPSFAAVITFVHGGADYGYLTAANWSSTAIPTATDNVVFDNSSTTLDGQTVVISGGAVANSWTFGSSTGTPLGAFNVTSSSTSAGRTINLTSGNITVDSSVTGTQSIAKTNATLTFVSGTGKLNLTNNSTTQALNVGSITAPNTDLYFSTAGGAITVDTAAFPTFGSLNGGNSNVQIIKTPGAARSITLSGTGSHTFSGAITGNASTLSLTVSGDSTFVQTLNGANTYTGGTTVTSGTLLLNGLNQEAGNVSVTGGTIGGSGIISRTASVGRSFTMSAGAKLAPGGVGTVGTFSVNWNALSSSTVDLSASSNGSGEYLFDLAAPGASDQFDVTASTTANVGGASGFKVGTLNFADFTFNPLAGFGPGTYTLFSGNTGSLAGSIGSNATGTIAGDAATLSIVGDQVVLNVTAVPEPASLGILGMAAAGLLLRRRKN